MYVITYMWNPKNKWISKTEIDLQVYIQMRRERRGRKVGGGDWEEQATMYNKIDRLRDIFYSPGKYSIICGDFKWSIIYKNAELLCCILKLICCKSTIQFFFNYHIEKIFSWVSKIKLFLSCHKYSFTAGIRVTFNV